MILIIFQEKKNCFKFFSNCNCAISQTNLLALSYWRKHEVCSYSSFHRNQNANNGLTTYACLNVERYGDLNPGVKTKVSSVLVKNTFIKAYSQVKRMISSVKDSFLCEVGILPFLHIRFSSFSSFVSHEFDYHEFWWNNKERFENHSNYTTFQFANYFIEFLTSYWLFDMMKHFLMIKS